MRGKAVAMLRFAGPAVQSADFSGEGPCVDSITVMSGLASSDRCHVNCQAWEGGSRFHQGQWKRSNEFPLCFPAWQTSTYCHFA